MQHAICYISTATEEVLEEEVNELLTKWREKNSIMDIKGILLYSEGHFFQVLEGEKEKVLSLFAKIKEDSRHAHVIQVLGKDLSQGSFNDYEVEHVKGSSFSKPRLIEKYCESVKGMDPQAQQQIKTILRSFIDTQVF